MANASIGNVDGKICYDALNHRSKIFSTQLLTSVQEVRRAVEMAFAKATGTRFSMRVLTCGLNEEQLRAVTCHYHGHTVICEAVIPISQQGDSIAYYGWNDLSRRTNAQYRWQETDLLRQVMERDSHHQHDYGGYTVEVPSANHEWATTDVEALLAIYERTFSGYLIAFTPQSVAEMLSSNRVSVVRHNDLIVAVAMAEIATLATSTGNLKICEVSEVATHPDFQRRGLSHWAFGELMLDLHKLGIDVIFSETRAVSYGMMAVARDAGLMPCGRLEQHCVISSNCSEVGQDGQYGDLVVFALLPSR